MNLSSSLFIFNNQFNLGMMNTQILFGFKKSHCHLKEIIFKEINKTSRFSLNIHILSTHKGLQI